MLKWFTYALRQVEMESGGHGYRSMVDDKGIAALFESELLPETVDLVADVPN